jgi:hypothetical protein
MSTYPIAEVLRRWSLGELSAEQAIGHLLQNHLWLTQQVADLAQRLRACEQRLNVNP